jgi:hypothetical protein
MRLLSRRRLRKRKTLVDPLLDEDEIGYPERQTIHLIFAEHLRIASHFEERCHGFIGSSSSYTLIITRFVEA